MVNKEIFLGSGASTTLIPEHDIYMPITGGVSGNVVTVETGFTDVYRLVPNLYIGCLIEIYDDNNTLLSTHSITSNTKTAFTLGSAPTAPTSPRVFEYALLLAYGSPAPHPLYSSRECLVADNWLGLMESVTFPNLSQEIKQMNLGLGGTRNFSFQYKGIRTADNGSLALVANTGSWLYYALGAIDGITYTGATANTLSITSTDVAADAASADDVIIYALTGSEDDTADVPETGPLFYRTVKGSTEIVPPMDFSIHDGTGFYGIPFSGSPSRPTDLINYTIKELNTDQLPSFSLEQSVSKDPAVLTTNAVFGATDTENEDVSFTRIARGCRINSLTIEAAEGEELKMNMDINARLVDSITDLYKDSNTTQACSQTALGTDLTVEDSSVLSIGMVVTGDSSLASNTTIASISSATSVVLSSATTTTLMTNPTTLTFTNNPNYVARAGQDNNANLFNWSAGSDNGAPFFFSQGTFSAFGQQFLKVNSVSITINNNLMDKRYMGGHRDMKEGIPAQRSYEISFEAVVTDDLLFSEMLNETEEISTTTGQMVEFTFTKPDTAEEITLKFKNYFLNTTEITIPDDKGPVSFSSTITPRDLHLCVVKTDNILMG